MAMRPAWRWLLAGGLMALAVAAVNLGLPRLASPAQGALVVFAATLVGWTVLDFDETPAAMVAALLLLGVGATTLEDFYAGLGDDFIWLLIGAFLLAAVLQNSGLAQRWALTIVQGSGTVRGLFFRLTGFIVATAFVLPSTSGRAALLLPVFLALAQSLSQPRLVRALALLFPSVILLSACVSMLGAGAHLVALDMMDRLGYDPPGFGMWLLLAGPFGLVSSLLATEAVLRLFLSPGERSSAVSLPAPQRQALTRAQWGVVAVTGVTLAAWASTSWHGVPPPVVALCGALAATFKPLTGANMKTALKQVEWNLVLFMTATLVMAEALVTSGAAAALADRLVDAMSIRHLPAATVLALASLVALLSHLVVTSRTARAAVLVPAVALPLAASGVDAALLVFVAVIGSGFCQTLLVSAKPVAMFAGDGKLNFAARDLAWLSVVLFPALWALLMVFALSVWPALGLGCDRMQSGSHPDGLRAESRLTASGSVRNPPTAFPGACP